MSLMLHLAHFNRSEGDGIARADLGAHLAAGAQGGIDERLGSLQAGIQLVALQDRRAADAEAQGAAVALVRQHFERRPGLAYLGQEHARLEGDQHRRLVQLQVLFQGGFDLSDVIRRNSLDVVDAEGTHQRLELDGNSWIALQRDARAGVLLVTGHTGDAVIHDDGDHGALVVDGVDQGRDAGVEEGRISDDRHVVLGTAGFDRPVRYGDAGAHAAAGMDGAERWDETEGVAADIAVDRHFELVQHIEYPPVRAARAEHGWAGRQRSHFAPRAAAHGRRQAADRPGWPIHAPRAGRARRSCGKMLLPSTGMPIRRTASSMNGSSSSMTISLSTEAANWRISCSGRGQVIPRRRMEAVGKDFLGILIRHTAGDDPKEAVARLDAVKGEGFGELGNIQDALLDDADGA